MALELRAFNLMRGLVIERKSPWPIPEGRLPQVVLMNVRRDGDSEDVWCFGRQVTGSADKAEPWAARFDYCDVVNVVGVVANPDDFGDDDFGV